MISYSTNFAFIPYFPVNIGHVSPNCERSHFVNEVVRSAESPEN